MKFLPSRQPTRDLSPRPSGYPDKAREAPAMAASAQDRGGAHYGRETRACEDLGGGSGRRTHWSEWSCELIKSDAATRPAGTRSVRTFSSRAGPSAASPEAVIRCI